MRIAAIGRSAIFGLATSLLAIMAQAQTKLVVPDPSSRLKIKNVLVLEGLSGSHAVSRASARANLVNILQPAVGFKLTIGNVDNVTDAYLAPFDIVVFNYFFETQTVFAGKPAETAFKNWLAKGYKGYVGYHNSGANEWSKQEWAWYQDNVTGMRYDVFHPDVPQGTIVKTTDPAIADQPILKGLAATYVANDEWYEYENSSKVLDPNFHAKVMYYLQNPQSVGVGRVPAPIHPVAWYREDDHNNRYFYSTFFHTPDAAATPFFQSLMLRALEYTAGYSIADGTGNVTIRPDDAPDRLAYMSGDKTLSVSLEAGYRLSVWSVRGEKLYAAQGDRPMTFAPAPLRKPGLYVVKVESETGVITRRVMVY